MKRDEIMKWLMTQDSWVVFYSFTTSKFCSLTILTSKSKYFLFWFSHFLSKMNQIIPIQFRYSDTSFKTHNIDMIWFDSCVFRGLNPVMQRQLEDNDGNDNFNDNDLWFIWFMIIWLIFGNDNEMTWFWWFDYDTTIM